MKGKRGNTEFNTRIARPAHSAADSKPNSDTQERGFKSRHRREFYP